jgi:hypothetical protein
MNILRGDIRVVIKTRILLLPIVSCDCGIFSAWVDDSRDFLRAGTYPERSQQGRLYEEDLPNEIRARRKGGLVEFTSGPVSILSIATSTSADRISAEVCVYLRVAWPHRSSTLT